jgi:hypothetical protein
MSADERFAERAEQLVAEMAQAERQKSLDAFEQLGQLVDAGELTWESVFAIQRELGTVAIEGSYPASVYQDEAIKRLERDMPGGGDE